MANRLKDLRVQRGLTQQALADLIGTTKQQVGRLESGKIRLHEQWVQKIAVALDIPAGDLWAESAETLTDQEQHLIKIYRQLDHEKQNLVAQFIDALKGR